MNGTLDGETIAAFVLHWSERLHGARAFVGRREDPAPHVPKDGAPAVATIARRGLRDLPEEARRALVGVHAGTHRAVVYDRAVDAREVIALQARGRRCVSLLGEGAPDLGPYATPLGFCVHDLGHLAAFFDPVHARGQLGFFRSLDRALDGPLAPILADHDEAFARELLAVGADTNGSPVFALASILMKLKMAVRRREGRKTGIVLTRGPLTEAEEAAFAPELARFVGALGMPDVFAPDAALVGTRRAHPEAARRLLAYFESCAETP